MTQLTEHQAYAAMYAFLENWYELSCSDEVGALLGSMSLLSDEQTADPAIWGDWLAAVEKAASGKVALRMELRQG
ncbi:MAG TPA: hypothetical protein VFN09_08755 [Rhodanobacteraceae bacterium]|nr:hypothetical protein [Rhodanobacteraceae bacterium]